MSLWFRRAQGMDSDTMREIAGNADVSWPTQSIRYSGDGIGYAEGDSSDASAIKDAAEALLGFRPVEISDPTTEE